MADASNFYMQRDTTRRSIDNCGFLSQRPDNARREIIEIFQRPRNRDLNNAAFIKLFPQCETTSTSIMTEERN